MTKPKLAVLSPNKMLHKICLISYNHTKSDHSYPQMLHKECFLIFNKKKELHFFSVIEPEMIFLFKEKVSSSTSPNPTSIEKSTIMDQLPIYLTHMSSLENTPTLDL